MSKSNYERPVAVALSAEAEAVRLRGAEAGYHVICGGRWSGKSSLADAAAIRVVARLPKGGLQVGFCVADAAEREQAKRRLIPKLGRWINREKSGRDKLVMGNDSAIHLIRLDLDFDLLRHLDMIIVDDAHKVGGFYELWRDQLFPFVQRQNAAAWIFGKPSGARDGIGRLSREMTGVPGWHVDRIEAHGEGELGELIEAARAELSPEAFAQEYEGVVHDAGIELSALQMIIKPGETFLQWCERLAETGLKVDGLPFKLDDRPTMRWIYSRVPSSIEEAYEKKLVIMKCTQVGFTVMEMLAAIYLGLRFAPAKVGMYVPGQALAALKSSERFMPIVRTIPEVHALMLSDVSGTKGGEGNVLVRKMGDSLFHFLWTSGKTTTESVPLDILSFDEVQEMPIAAMEKTNERLSGSKIRFTLMGSTANWPDRDIHFWFKKGTQHQFHTHCGECGTYQVLDDHFPQCISKRDGEYRYVCHECNEVIPDPQVGEWRAKFPEKEIESIHYPQFLSPTISAKNIIEAYNEADDMKNFFNRKLGKPYTDPSTVPVNLEMLNKCAELGMELGVEWQSRAADTFMGIDQMGRFNVVLIAKRLPSGHMAIIHAEEIYSDDPFERCDVLMKQYGVRVCCVETLPNYNDAKRFANRHEGKVFLAGYGNMDGNMMIWGDSVPNKQERKTDEEDRDRYTVRLDQFKCMQVAMKRISSKVCVFPDPMGLMQEIVEKGLKHVVPVLKDRVFEHFTHTALIVEQDEEEKKFKRRVVKIGIDPHFSYAYMLLNVAWARSHGTTMFLTMDEEPGRPEMAAKVERRMPGLPSAVLDMIQLSGEVCGRCFNYVEGRCTERGFLVEATDTGCPLYVENPDL